MNQPFIGSIDVEKIKPIREMLKGALVLKGIVNEEDTQKAIELGVDGIIVSNHGGRQIDAGESSIKSLSLSTCKNIFPLSVPFLKTLLSLLQ